MCLASKYRFPKIAKRNIRCDKSVGILCNPNVWSPLVWRNGKEYKFNEVILPHTIGGHILEHLVATPSSDVSGIFEVTEGFHSYKRGTHVKLDYTKIAIIPRGAEYFIGVHDDLVANKIIVFSNKKEYWKWRIKNLLGRA